MDDLRKIYDRVNNELDKTYENTDREKSLFNCLDLPEDKVKLAVVKCLFSVDLKFFSDSEVESLVEVI